MRAITPREASPALLNPLFYIIGMVPYTDFEFLWTQSRTRYCNHLEPTSAVFFHHFVINFLGLIVAENFGWRGKSKRLSRMFLRVNFVGSLEGRIKAYLLISVGTRWWWWRRRWRQGCIVGIRRVGALAVVRRLLIMLSLLILIIELTRLIILIEWIRR